MAEERDETEIDLLQLAKALVKRWWAIALAAILAAALTLSYTVFLVTPMYEASASFYVNSKNIDLSTVSITASDLTAAKSLVNTYIVILKTRTTLNEVIEKSGVDYTYEELKEMISASSVESTEVFEITVTSPDPEEAETIANTIAMVLPDKVSSIVDGTSVRIVDTAIVPAERSSPSYIKNTVIGFLVGFIVSCGVIIVMDIFDDNVRSEDYLSQTYPDIPLLAVIPDLDSHTKSGYGYGYGYGEQESHPASKKTTSKGGKH